MSELDLYRTGTKQLLTVHGKDVCTGPPCVIHAPSDHKMKNFPTHWRSDRALIERICPHGIGHPDPDDIEFKRKLKGDEFARQESVHGCCGICCVGAYETMGK